MKNHCDLVENFFNDTEIAFFNKYNNYIIKKYKTRYLYLLDRIPFEQLKKINNKNIIKLISYNIDSNETIYEFFDSKTLDLFLMEDYLSFDNFYNIIAQLAEGVDELHKNDLIHNDIRMRNILVNQDMLVKINDFDFLKYKQNEDMKLIDIFSYANLVLRLISITHEWNSLKKLNFSYNTFNLDFSSCKKFLYSLQLNKLSNN